MPDNDHEFSDAATEADARAKMILYLLDSKTNGLSAGNPAAFVYSC